MSRLIFVLLLGCAASAPKPSGQETFQAALDPKSEVPLVAIDGPQPSGNATFTVTGATIAYKVAVSGLSSAFTASHIHAGAAGTNGPVVVPLQVTAGAPGTASGAGTIDAASIKGKKADGSPMTMDDLLGAMRSGDLYVNVHTAGNKGGEIRGQIKP